jgi:hypothetical protein
MSRFLDARIPLVFAEPAQAGPEDALLIEGGGAAEGAIARFEVALTPYHPAGCVCCAPRNVAGQALSRLLLARARGEIPFFRRVVAVVGTDPGRQAVLAALEADPIASGCFRLSVGVA